jgi:malate dehydrogenase
MAHTHTHTLTHTQIPTKAIVTGYLPSAGSWPATTNQGLAQALTGAKIVVIPAGVPRKPGMTRDDLFNVRCLVVIGWP